MIQLRNVPDALHRKLKARAALAGMFVVGLPVGRVQRNPRATNTQRISGTSA